MSNSFAPANSLSAMLGNPSKDLVLRIRNTIHEGRLVRLSAGKCTIGSARDCTLRLRADGVAPTHCLILRGRRHTVVRRWAEDTRLNDRSFDDARLEVGDRLGIGPLELEVVENPTDTDGSDTIPQPTDDDDEAQRAAEELRQRQDQADRDRAACDERQRQLDILSAELTERRQQFAGQTRAWELERERIRQECDQQSAEIAAQRGQLEAERQAWGNDRQQQLDAATDDRRLLESERQTLRRQSPVDRGRTTITGSATTRFGIAAADTGVPSAAHCVSPCKPR